MARITRFHPYEDWREALAKTTALAQSFRDDCHSKSREISTQSSLSSTRPQIGTGTLSSSTLGRTSPQDPVSERNSEGKHFVVGIDYGTTFTSVSYCSHPRGDRSEGRLVTVGDIKTIKNWPNDPSNGLAEQVPTESWYPSVQLPRTHVQDQFDDPSGQARYGTNILHDRNLSHEVNDDEDEDMDSDESTEFLWGYAVPYQRYKANTNRNPLRRIERPKLMLLSTNYTDGDRKVLRKQLNKLIRRGIIRKFGKRTVPDIRDVRDVITDFLVHVFKHTKEQLIKHENFNDQCTVEFVFTVPTIWSAESSRVLQLSMEAAIQATEFGTLEDGSVQNLTFISEPEAAAQFLAGSSLSMIAGESVGVLDCGGGTVDITTLSVDTSYPLRFKEEIVAPSGDNCGGSYANVGYYQLLYERLRTETYLEGNGETIRSHINYLIPDFENIDKRKKDITKSRVLGRVRIPGLRGDKRTGVPNRFEDNHILLDYRDYEAIFMPLLTRIGKVVEQQLQAARKAGHVVKSLFLIGGFAGAPSVRSWLRLFLDGLSKEMGLPFPINLIEDTKKCVTAVSAGAVIRALDMGNGPERHISSSYGFFQHEPYNPWGCVEHKATEPILDEVDGIQYVPVVNYFITRGIKTPAVHEFPPLRMCHTFPVAAETFLCEELLYVSDTATKSHYTLNSSKNRNKCNLVGRIVVDWHFLKTKYGLKPTPKLDEDGEPARELYYQIEYDLVPMIKGQSLRFEARYFVSDAARKRGDWEVPEGASKVISIAAAFGPGNGVGKARQWD